MNDDALRDTLRDPAFDQGVAPDRLLAAVHAREERLLRRRRTAAAVAAAVATVGVLAGAAALTMRPEPVVPAAPPSPTSVVEVTPVPSETPAPTTTELPTSRTTTRQVPGLPPSALPQVVEPPRTVAPETPPAVVTVAPEATR